MCTKLILLSISLGKYVVHKFASVNTKQIGADFLTNFGISVKLKLIDTTTSVSTTRAVRNILNFVITDGYSDARSDALLVSDWTRRA